MKYGKFQYPNQHTLWDDHNVEKLKRLWAEGLSFSKIAVQIPGATRNCVAGKIYRLGLPSRARADKNGDGEPPKSPAAARRAAA